MKKNSNTGKKSQIELTELEGALLELLSRGLMGREMASSLGYSPGTIRVYLHKLYAKLGVAGRSDAVEYFSRIAPSKPVSVQTAEAGTADATLDPLTLGGFACTYGLGKALGAMQVFIGPFAKGRSGYEHLGGVAVKNGSPESGLVARSRELWSALLDGRFESAKSYISALGPDQAVAQSKSSALIAYAMLSLGGFTALAERLHQGMPAKRNGAGVTTLDERKFMGALRGDVSTWDDYRISALTNLVQSQLTRQALRELALVTLFHLYRTHNKPAPAAQLACTLWAECDRARADLESEGVDDFASQLLGPPPAPQLPEKPLAEYLEKIAQ